VFKGSSLQLAACFDSAEPFSPEGFDPELTYDGTSQAGCWPIPRQPAKNQPATSYFRPELKSKAAKS
jgi:hypothetical protein